ncbi:hypothetical protein DPMN_122198 [Dreissena polymorpha]|uniref:Uncharacterized protein n=1 Tax=Dreissena polymorpha TaxID=45954 RepID=A0A9D4GP78_DREPO|nr:hypothetical protein DPMN_122198 [Dreissena polymorpha]
MGGMHVLQTVLVQNCTRSQALAPVMRCSCFCLAPQPKKNKSLDDDSDDYKSSSLFYLSCRSAGLHLKNGHKYNVLGQYASLQ